MWAIISSNDFQQVEARSVYDQLIILSRASALSTTDLQATFNSKMNVRQPGTKHLLMHLIISFLLFTHNGNTIAREFIASVSISLLFICLTFSKIIYLLASSLDMA